MSSEIFEYADKVPKLYGDKRFEAIENARTDIYEIKEWASEVEKKFLPSSAVPGRIYLQIAGMHVLLISRLEYALKSLGKIKGQWDLHEYIKNSCLSEQDRLHLLWLFLRRHPIIHNLDKPDKSFHKKLDEHNLGEMKVHFPIGKAITTASVRDIPYFVGLIEQILNDEWKKAFGFRHISEIDK